MAAFERIIVLVDDAGWVDRTAAAVHALIGTSAAAGATVTVSDALLAARAAVSDEIGARDRLLVLALLGAAMLLACRIRRGRLDLADQVLANGEVAGALGATLSLFATGYVLAAIIGIALGLVMGTSQTGSCGHRSWNISCETSRCRRLTALR